MLILPGTDACVDWSWKGLCGSDGGIFPSDKAGELVVVVTEADPEQEVLMQLCPGQAEESTVPKLAASSAEFRAMRAGEAETGGKSSGWSEFSEKVSGKVRCVSGFSVVSGCEEGRASSKGAREDRRLLCC